MKITLEGSPKELKEFLSPNVDARKLWKQIKTSALQPMSEKQYSKWIKSVKSCALCSLSIIKFTFLLEDEFII